VTIGNFEFKITAGDNRRIQSLHIVVPREHKITGKIVD